MVSDAPAQADPLTDQVVPTETAQAPSPASAPVASPASQIETLLASEPVTSAFDYSTVDGIREAAKANKALQDYLTKERIDAEKRGADKRDKDLRLQSGSAESVTKYHQTYIDRLNAGEDPAVLAKETPAFVQANAEWALVQTLTALVQPAFEGLSDEQKDILRADIEAAPQDSAKMTAVAEKTLAALQARIVRTTRESLDPEAEYNENPKFKEWADARVAKELETELTAQRTEQAARPGAPAMPVGTTPDASGDLVDNYMNMPEPERMAYALDLATNAPEEFERLEKALMDASGLRG